ncbi:MAG: alpha/beta hydrolase [Gammaproteobacteria bacterium]|nr:alpha/beta hydrolase [Gammaproteobacteria bacterium]
MKKVTKLIRGLKTRVYEWGNSGNPTLFYLHGWMDSGASFKYVAEFLQKNYHVVAPDLRGFGETEHAQGYWFPDYLADFEALLNLYACSESVDLVGHSMGGNIGALYAGIRPDRVRSLLILDALGLETTKPKDAVTKYRTWLDQIVPDTESKVYPSESALRRSILKVNPNLPSAVVDDLMQIWARQIDGGDQYELKHDHRHRFVNPVRYNFDEVLEIWKEVRARVGLVLADKSWKYDSLLDSGRLDLGRASLRIKDEDLFTIKGSGHMLHLEKPRATSDCIARFFNKH